MPLKAALGSWLGSENAWPVLSSCCNLVSAVWSESSWVSNVCRVYESLTHNVGMEPMIDMAA